MTLRKLTLIGLTLALLLPMTLLAQPPDNPGNGNGNGDRGRGGSLVRELLPPPGYLQLTDEQKDATRALAEDLRAALEPIREEQRALAEDLRTALEADAPDATTVGQLTLDLRGLSQQSRDEIAAFADDFRDLLDAEQQTKWDNFVELRRLGRRGNGSQMSAARRIFGGG